MAHSNKSITFDMDVFPSQDNVYSLGTTNKEWKIFGTILGGTAGLILKSNGTNSSWQDEYKVIIEDWTENS